MRKIIVLVLALLLCSVSVNVYAEEPDTKIENILSRATEYNGNYYLFVETNCTWKQAKAYCEGLGGHLVTITSQEEDDLCFQMMKSLRYTGCWLGASDLETEGVWKWVTNEPWQFSNWGGDEPNGTTKENLLSYYDVYNDGRWNDNAADVKFPFVCEWEKESISQVKEKYGWVISSDPKYKNAFYFNGNIYNIFHYEMDWDAAKEYCQKIGGHLATITSEQENQALFAYVTKADPDYSCVFGASDREHEGLWQWVTGEPMTYLNWGQGEPNNSGGNEHYIHFLNSFDGAWNDTKWQNSFLCEWNHCCVTEDGVFPTHHFTEEEVIGQASCTSAGEIKRICGNCGYATHETVEQLPHAYKEVQTKKATCTSAGELKQICADCGHTVTSTIDPLPHEYGDYVVVSGNKLIPPIVKEKTCAVCHEVQTQNDWSNVWITVLAGVAVLALIVGVISYAKAFKKRF